MKKFEINGFTATVTNKVVKWEIPISNLVNAFQYSPDNFDEMTVKRGKSLEFAEIVTKKLLEEYNQETGSSRLEEAIDGVFNEMCDDGLECLVYPDEDEE